MLFAPVALLAFVSSALAYTVTVPNETEGWTNNGPQPFSWTRVSTDRLNFTVLLTNSDRSLMPTDQVLAALVNGDLGSVAVLPPSAGWPSPGRNYRLNIVDSATNLSSILAQSPPFAIEAANETTITTTRRFSTTLGSTSTQQAGSQPTDDTIDEPKDPKSSAALFKVPVALAAGAALMSAVLL